MSTFKWTSPESVQTAFAASLDALGAGNVTSSAVIANNTGLYPYINLELKLASVNYITATGLAVYVWFLPTIDGTNYESYTEASGSARPADVIIPLTNYSGSQRIPITNVPIPPLDFVMLLKNNVSAAFPAADNTLTYRRHYLQSV